MPSENGETTKTKKPADSAFKQQRLPAWQPILTAGTVLPTFFVIGIAFIPIGVGLLYFSDEVKELVIDYTHCNKSIFDGGEWKNTTDICADIIKSNSSAKCTCVLFFHIATNFEGKVFMYYGLSNFYQNHRRYVKSRDDNQLLGKIEEELSSDCVPFAKAYDENAKKELPIAPCGAIANSLFNDTLTLYLKNNSNSPVPVLKRGIAWDSDRNIKFRNPPGVLKDVFKNYAKPQAWTKHIWELDSEDENNGFQNEDLIVWMRTAAFPTFRKLYRRIDHSKTGFESGLPKGEYELQIDYFYDVSAFDGSKRMILSTTSLLGGKNPFLGIAYIVVGCVCLLLGIALLFIHIKCGKSTSEMIHVNPRTPYQ